MNWSSLSLFSAKPNLLIRGKISRVNQSQESVQLLPLNRIVVLSFGDLDEELARELIDRKVKAVVHCGHVMSGEYPTEGPLLLLQQHITIWGLDAGYFEACVTDGEMMIYPDLIQISGVDMPSRAFTRNDWLLAQQAANSYVSNRVERFVDQTLISAMREQRDIMASLPKLPLRTKLTGRHAMIVSNGKGHKRELLAAKVFIHSFKPILIGVGEGADTLLANGYVPDIVIGEWHQISQQASECGAEIIIHTNTKEVLANDAHLTFRDSFQYTLLCSGNSEDAALLVAEDQGAEWLITVGVKSHLEEFLARGYEEMGSSLLVRLKVGARLVDSKSLNMLYAPSKQRMKEASSTVILSCLFIGLSFYQFHWILKRTAHEVWKLVGIE
jgi:uncharacterized membrane-anchored protein